MFNFPLSGIRSLLRGYGNEKNNRWARGLIAQGGARKSNEFLTKLCLSFLK
jgi:hypothetical protein